MAEVVPLHLHTRRRRSIRAYGAFNRRKKKSAGFDVAAALELNFDRYPMKDGLLQLLVAWRETAKLAGLAATQPDYVKALERAIVVMSKAPSPEHAIESLQAR